MAGLHRRPLLLQLLDAGSGERDRPRHRLRRHVVRRVGELCCVDARRRLRVGGCAQWLKAACRWWCRGLLRPGACFGAAVQGATASGPRPSEALWGWRPLRAILRLLDGVRDYAPPLARRLAHAELALGGRRRGRADPLAVAHGDAAAARLVLLLLQCGPHLDEPLAHHLDLRLHPPLPSPLPQEVALLLQLLRALSQLRLAEPSGGHGASVVSAAAAAVVPAVIRAFAAGAPLVEGAHLRREALPRCLPGPLRRLRRWAVLQQLPKVLLKEVAPREVRGLLRFPSLCPGCARRARPPFGRRGVSDGLCVLYVDRCALHGERLIARSFCRVVLINYHVILLGSSCDLRVGAARVGGFRLIALFRRRLHAWLQLRGLSREAAIWSSARCLHVVVAEDEVA
mmetsp:Transcript_29588/g.70480  ORF Transcript_29588/g.70480 Transcript_29588/m.70480 type:complete len:399 (+) Transcript_29588:1080-2276(+)